MALMLVLETLSPTERVVFVLREVFEVGYDEIADAVGKTTAAVRQIAHRARAHVEARRPRATVSAHEIRTVLDSFQRALETWDIQGLLDVLAPDVVIMSDGGGLVQAALRPVVGAEKVIRLALGGIRKTGAQLSFEQVVVNGNPAFVLSVDGQVDGVLAVRVEDRRVVGLYYVRNPEKLTHIGSETVLTLS